MIPPLSIPVYERNVFCSVKAHLSSYYNSFHEMSRSPPRHHHRQRCHSPSLCSPTTNGSPAIHLDSLIFPSALTQPIPKHNVMGRRYVAFEILGYLLKLPQVVGIKVVASKLCLPLMLCALAFLVWICSSVGNPPKVYPTPSSPHLSRVSIVSTITALTTCPLGFEMLSPEEKSLLSKQIYTNRTLKLVPPLVMFDEVDERCWAFKGAHAQVAFRMSAIVIPTRLAISFNASQFPISWAPRGVTVWGADDECTEVKGDRQLFLSDFWLHGRIPPTSSDACVHSLGTYEYDVSSPSPQHFTLNTTKAFQTFIVQITSNWGSDSTCIHTIAVYV